MSRKDARLAPVSKADSFFVPVCLALLLHAVVFSAAFLGWSASIHIPDRVKPPQIVQARILAMAPKAPTVASQPTPAPPPPPPPPEEDKKKEEQEKREEEKKKLQEQKQREEEQQRQRALKKKEEEEKKKKELERKKKEEEERKKKELERQKKLEEERKKKEEEDQRRREEEERKRVIEEKRKRVEEYLRQQAEAQEFAAQQAEADAVAVASYQDANRRLVARYWSRPPNARSGMEVTVQIQLVPGGEVIDVLVLQSSGNAAFDRSAINAIRSAARLPVPEDQRLFDKSFRRFKMRFRPEDLSW